VTVLAWHPTKPWIASGSEDLSVKILDYVKGRVVHEFKGLLNEPVFMTFSPAGSKLAVKTEYDFLTRIWDLEDGVREMVAPEEEKTLTLKKGLSKAEIHRNATEQLRPDAEGWLNLLAPLTPDVMALLDSSWVINGDRMMARQRSLFPLPGMFSGTGYEVHLKVQRRKVNDYLMVALPVGDRMAGFMIDALPKDGYVTGLELVDGKKAKQVPGSIHGLLWKEQELHDLQISVKLAGANANIACALDGKQFYSWSGPVDKLSMEPNRPQPLSGAIGIEAGAPGWQVLAIKVKRL
jgi:WD40 repeat protein